jgi:hypothetical protein
MSSVGRRMRVARIFDEYRRTFVIATDSPVTVEAISGMVHQNESIDNALRII